MKFKVGDKVVLLKHSSTASWAHDQIATILAVDINACEVKVRNPNTGSLVTGWLDVERMKSLEEPNIYDLFDPAALR